MLRSDPALGRRQRKCLHKHWKSCHDYPEAHTWEARDQKDIEEEEAVRALVAAEDDSYLAYDEACRVRQLIPRCWQEGHYRTDEGHVTRSCVLYNVGAYTYLELPWAWLLAVKTGGIVDASPAACPAMSLEGVAVVWSIGIGAVVPIWTVLDGFVILLASFLPPLLAEHCHWSVHGLGEGAYNRKCLHEHWKSCHDYPEAHTWEARDQADIKEEEAVRALIVAEDNSYLTYDEACKVCQLIPRCWQENHYRKGESHVTRSCDGPGSHQGTRRMEEQSQVAGTLKVASGTGWYTVVSR
ncbi:hypothetical protein EI94DRAFT_1703301 [Lactarius quietus]|nr:hypothetical protein EI94DRAFT_1703301 [Lactarius quietus]